MHSQVAATSIACGGKSTQNVDSKFTLIVPKKKTWSLGSFDGRPHYSYIADVGGRRRGCTGRRKSEADPVPNPAEL
jgi:hypothetical protein